MVDPLPVGCNREAGSSVFGGPLGTAIDGGSIGSGSGLREGGLAGLGSLTAFPAPNSEVGRLDLGGLGDFPSLGTAVEGGAAALSGTGSGLREGGVVSLEAGLGSPKASPTPELYSQEGLGYIASALGRPLYTDRTTALKQHLDFAVEVGAKVDFPGSVLVELSEGNRVEVSVDLVWAPPRCAHCNIFGHLGEQCSKKAGDDGLYGCVK